MLCAKRAVARFCIHAEFANLFSIRIKKSWDYIKESGILKNAKYEPEKDVLPRNYSKFIFRKCLRIPGIIQLHPINYSIIALFCQNKHFKRLFRLISRNSFSFQYGNEIEKLLLKLKQQASQELVQTLPTEWETPSVLQMWEGQGMPGSSRAACAASPSQAMCSHQGARVRLGPPCSQRAHKD